MVSTNLTIETRLFIGNEFIEGAKRETFPVINPTTEEKICDVFQANQEDIDLAVKAAQQGFITWSKMDLMERRRHMLNLSKGVQKHLEDLAQIEALNTGQPIKNYIEFEHGVELPNIIEYYAGYTEKLKGESYLMPQTSNFNCTTYRVPYGVVGCITPWNYPLLMAAWKIFAAIAAGNAVILKPSEFAPLSCIKLAQIAKEVGFPSGVLNVVNGYGHITGEAITRHMGIQKVTFTGSTATGRNVMRACAESNIKPLHIELGGKSPAVLFSDCDIDSALDSLMLSSFSNTSQNCVCSSRIYVQDEIYKTFVEKFTQRVKQLKVGHYTDKDSFMGPVICKRQYDNIMKFIDHGLNNEKLTLQLGGNQKRLFEKGFYIEPTIFINVPDDSKLAREEIFGPVSCVMTPFKTVDEAITRAEDTAYGLASYVFTRDMNKAEYFTRKINSGSVFVNCGEVNNCFYPFGGMKMSGFGKDNGEEAVSEYMHTKAVYQAFNFNF